MIGIDSPENDHGLFLPEKLPDYPHITTDDIQYVAQNAIGLRTVHPSKLEDERANGTRMGDFILTYYVGHLLGLDEERLRQERPNFGTGSLSEDLKKLVTQNIFRDSDSQFKDCLSGLDELPTGYEDTLAKFFQKQAIPAMGAGHLLSRNANLREYIAVSTQNIPALLLVKDNHPGTGYDEDQYGFPKHGSSLITPDMIQDSAVGITEKEKSLLARRYGPYLDICAADTIGVSRQKFSDAVDRDVLRMLVGKTVTMLQKIRPPKL